MIINKTVNSLRNSQIFSLKFTKVHDLVVGTVSCSSVCGSRTCGDKLRCVFMYSAHKIKCTDLVSRATAQANGVSRRLMMSSVTSSLQCSSRFFMAVQTQRHFIYSTKEVIDRRQID